MQNFTGILGLCFFFLLFLHSCNKEDFPDDCNGYSAAIYKHGNASLEGSYQNIEGYAIFAKERLTDTTTGLWIHDEIEKSIMISEVNDFCVEKLQLLIKNIIPSVTDTFRILPSNNGSVEIPTAYLYYLDADAVLDQYDLLETDATDNFLIIDSINADTTVISGRLQLSFVSTYDHEKKDDPNRPDTLHFTNGTFTAEFADF